MTNRVVCNICHNDYSKNYIKKHIIKIHKKSDDKTASNKNEEPPLTKYKRVSDETKSIYTVERLVRMGKRLYLITKCKYCGTLQKKRRGDDNGWYKRACEHTGCEHNYKTQTYIKYKEIIENLGFTLITKLEEYKSCHDKTIVYHQLCDRTFSTSLVNFVKQGHVCNGSCLCENTCGCRKWVENRTEIIKSMKGELLSNTTTPIRLKVKIKCSNGHIFETVYHRLKRGRWCPSCSKNKPVQYDDMMKISKTKNFNLSTTKKEFDNLSGPKGRKKFLFTCVFSHEHLLTRFELKKFENCKFCHKNNLFYGRIQEHIELLKNDRIISSRGVYIPKNKADFSIFINKELNERGNMFQIISRCENDHIFTSYMNGLLKRCPECFGYDKNEGTPHDKEITLSGVLGSRKENLMYNIAQSLELNIKIQHIYFNCKNISYLPFDFYLVDHNVLIEMDGKQHFQHIKHFHRTKNSFSQRKLTDRKKSQFAYQNGINLLRISYLTLPNQIELILKQFLYNIKKTSQVLHSYYITKDIFIHLNPEKEIKNIVYEKEFWDEDSKTIYYIYLNQLKNEQISNKNIKNDSS